MATTMTEIPIKDLALTTAPAGKQLLVRDASAGLQRIDYDQIAKNLVESYGSSSLAGKNQSIKAAIDSLNSGLTQNASSISAINDSLSNIKIKYTECFRFALAGEQNASQSFYINNIQKYSYLYIIVYADDWEGYVLPSCIDHIQIAGHARYDFSNAEYFCRGAIFVNQTNGACYQKLLKMNGQSGIEIRIYGAYLA